MSEQRMSRARQEKIARIYNGWVIAGFAEQTIDDVPIIPELLQGLKADREKCRDYEEFIGGLNARIKELCAQLTRIQDILDDPSERNIHEDIQEVLDS